MNDNDQVIRRRKSSATWSFLNPEERSILTASQLNAQNQKVRKGLEVITKGLEDEKRCEKVAHAKEQIMLKNRLSRLSKASEHMARRAMASMTSIEATSSYLSRTSSGRDIMKRASEALQRKQASEAQVRLQQWYSDTDGGKRRVSLFYSDQAGFFDSDKRKVRFDQEHFNTDDNESKNKTSYSRDSTLQLSGVNSPRSVISSFMNLSSLSKNRASDDSFLIDDERQLKGSKMPSCLDYYVAPVVRKISLPTCKGFSRNAASFNNYAKERNSLNQVSGLSNEMQRWRRLPTTRATNARLKAIRPLGRRHTAMTLQEALDDNARIRKDIAIRIPDFTPHTAWQMLNCRYLRLTHDNVKMLEQVCGEAGYDTSVHPHSTQVLASDLTLEVPPPKVLVDESLSDMMEEETFLAA